MRLYFLRHGEAADPAAYSDEERPLSEAGRHQASAVARFFSDRGLRLDTILCSPLLRARQTAEAVQAAYAALPLKTSENLLSSADPLAILEELGTSRADDLLLVGHEPHLSKTISRLLGLDSKKGVEMKTCTLACIVATPPPGPGRGMLIWLLPSGELMR
jgi:phosphohistidine phosphatase